MKLLLEIPDNRAPEVMEVLNSIPFIKYNPLENLDSIPTNGHKKSLHTTNKKDKTLKNFKQAIEEVNLIKAGKLKGFDAKELLNDL